MKTLLVLFALCAALAIVPACEDDCAYCPPPESLLQPRFQNLSERWHVLNNVELAYTKRDVVKYDQLLDSNFTFFLSVGDVGGDLPDSWNRDVEVQANINLFSKDQPPAPLKRCLRILMSIRWEDDHGKPDLAWVALTPPNSSETWYATTVSYDFQFEVEGDLTYINAPGSMAQFTVRNAGTEEAPQWRLVEMRDLGGAGLVAGLAAMTESKTWGGVKSMYR